MEVLGYERCACGALVLEQTWHQTGRRCIPCFRDGIERLPKVLPIFGRELRMPPRRRVGSRGSKGAKHGQHLKDKAERAALRKLRAMYPETYQALLVVERAERGIPMLPPTGGQTSAAEALYAAAATRGAPPCAEPDPATS